LAGVERDQPAVPTPPELRALLRQLPLPDLLDLRSGLRALLSAEDAIQLRVVPPPTPPPA